MTENLAAGLWLTCERSGDTPAIRSVGGSDYSYRDLVEATCGLADVLTKEGVGPGARAAILLPNGFDFTIAYFAVLWVGGIVVPLNPALTAPEVAAALSDAGARLVVCDESTADRVDPTLAVRRLSISEAEGAEPLPPVPIDGARPAAILYTSGTMGPPKGVVLTHGNLRHNADWVATRSLDGVRWGPGDTVMAALPLSHSFGQTCAQNAALLHGSAVTYTVRFNPGQCLADMVTTGTTVFVCVPRMAAELLKIAEAEQVKLLELKWCLVGGAPIPADLVAAFEDRFGATVLEGYGLTETSPVCVFRTPETPRREGSVGRPIADVKVRIRLDDGSMVCRGGPGELLVHGAPVMAGYYQNPAATDAVLTDGWLWTGDVARIDDDGLVYIVGRTKDVIIKNGYTVYPTEVEAVIGKLPHVADVAVIGVPDEAVGEEIVAFVVPDGDLDLAALDRHLRSQLAHFKRPGRIEAFDRIPRGSKGQVLRAALAAGS